MQTPPPLIMNVAINDETLGLHLQDGRFISVPIGFYPTLALANPGERLRFEIHGSSIYWPELDADIGVEGLSVLPAGPPASAPLLKSDISFA